jgi:2-succinyl-5-enolpyruvyl-6-hydroxy-3-cyclohexene-1-carboxylate synthase
MTDVTTSFVRALVDEWARAGIRHAVVAPGSRNTPLALALVRDDRIAVDVVLDERSAGFRALGSALATGTPVIVCCTSGTAGANLLPAVLEAHHARVPLLICTADRPPELRDVGAGQTIDQTNLYGTAVRWFHDPGPPVAGGHAPAQWRALACRAVDHALGTPHGPVHLNLPFREPLLPTGDALVDGVGRADGAPWVRTTRGYAAPDPAHVALLADLVRAHPRGVVVAGWGAGIDAETVSAFAGAAGWPVFADAISNVRTGPHVVSTYEAIARVEAFTREHQPDLVVRIGAPLTSKATNAWLHGVPSVVIDPDDRWLDPARDAAERVVAVPGPTLAALADALGPRPSSNWQMTWADAERIVRRAIDRVLDDGEPAVEGRIARDLAAVVPDGGSLVVASSLPVRALEWCMAPRAGLRVFSNRGVNGIDGFVSTAAGIAHTGAEAPVVALCGDLCFLHDNNGLLTVRPDDALTFVVVDNDGGGIFSYLPQHELPEFEQLFATPQGVDLVAVARAHGLRAERIEGGADWGDIVGGGVQVAVVPVDRGKSGELHRQLWAAAATEISG